MKTMTRKLSSNWTLYIRWAHSHWGWSWGFGYFANPYGARVAHYSFLFWTLTVHLQKRLFEDSDDEEGEL